ncbi:MAG: peptide chain release factor 1 [Candidatus Dormibacteraceae bacterium]
MIDRLEAVLRRQREIEREMARPAVAADHEALSRLAREQASTRDLAVSYENYKAARAALAEARELLRQESEPQMQEFLRAEESAAGARMEEVDARLKELLLPRDPNDDRDVVVEIQAAEGGQEAALFAADLFRMYTHWAQSKGWKVDLIDLHDTGIGGFDKVEFEVRGASAYAMLKYEGGVHRVQRVPETESQGRIHTSAATVAVMPEADPVDVELSEKDLKIETSTSQGHGGQSVNTTYSKVIITHLPTGIVVACQDQRSQLQNRERALRVLRARLYDKRLAEQMEAQGAQRRSMVRTGNRSEKIRTYNFKENRVTDHRIGLTLYRLERILAGDLDEIVTALAQAERAEQLAGAEAV